MRITQRNNNPCWAGAGVMLLLMLSLPRPAAAQPGTFSPTGSMITARFGHTATLLPNGKVLVAGGDNSSGDLTSAELFNPATGTFSPTGSMNVPRNTQTATLLQNGQVLVAGGPPFTLPGGSAELYNPATGTFTNTGSMAFPHYGPLAGLLPDGRVVSVCNISDPGVPRCGAELYSPASGTWSDGGQADPSAAGGYTLTMLNNGRVLISGGADQFGSDSRRRIVRVVLPFEPPITSTCPFASRIAV